jgi:hypothetical protein
MTPSNSVIAQWGGIKPWPLLQAASCLPAKNRVLQKAISRI